MNIKQFIAVILLLITGCTALLFLINVLQEDLLFYRTAKQESVFVQVVRINISRETIQDHAGQYSRAANELTLMTSAGVKTVQDVYDGSERDVKIYTDNLSSMRGREVPIFISDVVPNRFALKLSFPLQGFFAMVLVLFLFVITPLGATIYYFFKSKK